MLKGPATFFFLQLRERPGVPETCMNDGVRREGMGRCGLIVRLTSPSRSPRTSEDSSNVAKIQGTGTNNFLSRTGTGPVPGRNGERKRDKRGSTTRCERQGREFRGRVVVGIAVYEIRAG